MCIGDGNPKPEVTITGLSNGKVTGKGVVVAAISGKEVLWCHAHNNKGPVVSRKLEGNAAGRCCVTFVSCLRSVCQFVLFP